MRRSAPRAVPKPKPPAVPDAPQAQPAEIAPVQQPTVAQGALLSMDPWGGAGIQGQDQSLHIKPVAPSADAQQKAGSQLKLSARHKGVVRV